MAKVFAERIAPQRKFFRGNFLTLFIGETRSAFLHGFCDERRSIHAHESARNAFRENNGNLAAFDFLCSEKFSRVSRCFIGNFGHRNFVPVAAALDKIAELAHAITNGNCTSSHRNRVALVGVEKSLVVCNNRKVAIQVCSQIRNILDFGRTSKRFFFKFNTEILDFCKSQRFQRRIIIGIIFRNLCRSRKFKVNLFGPLRVANSILNRLRNRFFSQAFRVGITRSTILDDANSKSNGIRNFGILHLALKNRQSLGMRSRCNNVELFSLALCEVTHTRNGVNDIHYTLLLALLASMRQ